LAWSESCVRKSDVLVLSPLMRTWDGSSIYGLARVFNHATASGMLWSNPARTLKQQLWQSSSYGGTRIGRVAGRLLWRDICSRKRGAGCRSSKYGALGRFSYGLQHGGHRSTVSPAWLSATRLWAPTRPTVIQFSEGKQRVPNQGCATKKCSRIRSA